MKLTNAFLREEYKRLNKRFFENLLPKDLSVKFGDLSEDNAHGLSTGDEILIDNRLRHSDCLTAIILLHEMVHISLPEYGGYPADGGHGMRFQARIVKLFEQGAYDGLL